MDPIFHIHNVNIINIWMKESGAKKKYKMTAMKVGYFSNIDFDTFKELSGVIFSVYLILPNVADCYLKYHLRTFY